MAPLTKQVMPHSARWSWKLLMTVGVTDCWPPGTPRVRGQLSEGRTDAAGIAGDLVGAPFPRAVLSGPEREGRTPECAQTGGWPRHGARSRAREHPALPDGWPLLSGAACRLGHRPSALPPG